ncbi:hypothetical protein HQ584_05085 [Patescibacteria group bacterium]|nr:hypothetical protein [Patescibacteria group bacterium]
MYIPFYLKKEDLKVRGKFLCFTDKDGEDKRIPIEQETKEMIRIKLEGHGELDDIQKEDYEDDIKNRCFLCGIKFKNSWEHYERYGNICLKCSARVTAVFDRRKTKEQADRELKFKRKEANFFNK